MSITVEVKDPVVVITLPESVAVKLATALIMTINFEESAWAEELHTAIEDATTAPSVVQFTYNALDEMFSEEPV